MIRHSDRIVSGLAFSRQLGVSAWSFCMSIAEKYHSTVLLGPKLQQVFQQFVAIDIKTVQNRYWALDSRRRQKGKLGSYAAKAGSTWLIYSGATNRDGSYPCGRSGGV
jgi:hypothetical protein